MLLLLKCKILCAYLFFDRNNILRNKVQKALKYNFIKWLKSWYKMYLILFLIINMVKALKKIQDSNILHYYIVFWHKIFRVEYFNQNSLNANIFLIIYKNTINENFSHKYEGLTRESHQLPDRNIVKSAVVGKFLPCV